MNVVPPLSPAEEHFLLRTLDRLRSLESRTRGLYAESLLCTLLPEATPSEYAAAAHDLEWPRPGGNRITLAVRTSGSQNSDHEPETEPQAGSWDFSAVANWSDPDSGGERRCWADVAVLCFHDGPDLSDGWRFYVLSSNQVEEFPARRLTSSNLAKGGYTSVGFKGLAAAIDSAVA